VENCSTGRRGSGYRSITYAGTDAGEPGGDAAIQAKEKWM